MSRSLNTVLFVDDEQNILEVLKRLLRKEDYRLLTALSGSEGLRIIKNAKVDLVISDQKMPEMEGTEFLKRVKEEYPSILTAILTGHADLETIKKSVNKGNVFRFFLKPWNSQELRMGIREMLYEYESRDTARIFEKRVIRSIMALSKRDMARAKESAGQTEEKRKPPMDSLDLPLAIVEDLPMPIIGVDSRKVMVLANQEARSLMKPGLEVTSGMRVSEMLPVDSASLEKGIEESIASGSRKTLEGCLVSGNVYDIDVIPLGREHTGRGAYLRFIPAVFPEASGQREWTEARGTN